RQGGAGQILDVTEIQQDLAAARVVDQTEELLADHLDILFVQNLAVDEINNRHIANVFNFEATAARLRGHTLTPSIPQTVRITWPGLKRSLSIFKRPALDVKVFPPFPREWAHPGRNKASGPILTKRLRAP